MIFDHACKLGLEGIVCKRIDLPYRPGPSKSWIKVKNKTHPAMLRVKEAFDLDVRARDGVRFSHLSRLKYYLLSVQSWRVH